MGKRPTDSPENEGDALKAGERPQIAENGDEVGDFEDEFEDEYESEDDIFEAGVDGRPDEEREAEERRGTWITPTSRGLNGSSSRVRHSQPVVMIKLLKVSAQMQWR